MKWALWALRRDAAWAKSGLAECTELAGLEEGVTEETLQAIGEHLDRCELCKKRDEYLNKTVGPMPPLHGGLFVRVMTFVGGLAPWQQSAAAGSLLLLMMGGIGVLWFVFLAIVNLDPTSLAAAAGLFVVLAGSGAVGGLVHHATAPIRVRGAVGYYVSWILTMYGYLAAVLGIVSVAALFVGWEAIGPELRDMVTTPFGLIVWLIMGAFFGVVVGRSIKQA